MNGTLDLSKLRASHLTTHRETTIPPMGTQEEEERHSELKGEILALTRVYRASHCDSKGFPRDTTFPQEAQQGIKDLKQMVKDQDLILLQTDKSGSLSLNSKANYVSQTSKHTAADPIVTPEDLHKKERHLNAATTQLARALGVGSSCGDHQATSLKSALINTRIDPPNLYGHPKDHKVLEPGKEHLGPPNRPICGAREAPNTQLSKLCSEVIHMAVEAERKLHPPTESKSTEDVIAAMKVFNSERRAQHPDSRPDIIIGSMDVEALYPSLDKDKDPKLAGDMITRHAHLFASFNWVEGSRFLALTLTPDQISHLGLTEVVQTRKFNGGQPPGIITPETATPLHQEILDDLSKFLPPIRQATPAEQGTILGTVISTATRMSMLEHTYKFNNKFHSQQSGGPMGDPVSVQLSRATMLSWDIGLTALFNSHVTKLRREEDLNKRYVDDHLSTYLSQPPGTRWKDDKSGLHIDPDKIQEDMTIPPDQRTMKLVVALANMVNPQIKMVHDCPSLHQSGKMPVLDLQVWVDQEGFLQWEHYRKPMANPLFPMSVSALPAKTRRTMHAQEGIRILRNCSETLDWSTPAAHLTDLMKRLQRSGYGHQYRVSILQSALAGYRKQQAAALEPGGRPLHRADTWQQECHAQRKTASKTNWYRAGGYESVLFVPPTPGSTLATSIRQMEARTRPRRDFSFRVVELGGVSLKRQLETLNPGQPTHCGSLDCLPCQSGKLGICHQTNVCYQISCTQCHEDIQEQRQQHAHQQQQPPQNLPKPYIYLGETSLNLRTRSSGHVYSLKRKDQSSALWKHSANHHHGKCDPTMFSMQVVTSHREPLSRQITEGVLIKTSQHPLMNSRSEYKQPRVTRVTMARTLGDTPPVPHPVPAQPNPGSAPTHSQPRTRRPRGGG